ncbi:site-specific integrase [Bacillus sp. 2205SS5-2]|uniref:site-specific integrase n=1 Tax=Bacillus sp. 2205SS5-2 TaxID=3109031 RepID=UPI0030054C08
MSNLNLNQSAVKELETFSESSFSLLETLESAKQTIAELINMEVFLSRSFDEDIWVLANPNSKGRTHTLDFNRFRFANKSLDIVLIVKCWVSEQLNNFKTTTVYHQYHYFLMGYEQSNGLDERGVDPFIRWLHLSQVNNNAKITIITSTLNFLDFSDLKNGEVYIPKLHEINQKLKFTRGIRKLPPSKEILTFSYYLDKYFLQLLDDRSEEGTKNNRQKEKILYYPILLWWRLTNIIPMRSVEFASIERNCLIKNDNNYFIRLPRRKLKSINKRNVQIIDTVAISKEMYEIINSYIKETEPFGETNTLISYPSLIWTDSSNRRKRQKRVIRNFNRENLQRLITKFYKEIINDKYNCNIKRGNQVSPNDTRHLAFTSLMMQGISPVEIARLGGHQTISAQYHYSSHLEYWIDSEVFKLLSRHRQLRFFEGKESIKHIPNEIKLKAFHPPTSNYKGKLKIGYCTDNLQRCESEECLLCSHWRIEPEEFLIRSNEIKKVLYKRRKHIHELHAFIENLHKNIINDRINYTNPKSIQQLKTLSNQINSEIRSISHLRALFIKEGFENE